MRFPPAPLVLRKSYRPRFASSSVSLGRDRIKLCGLPLCAPAHDVTSGASCDAVLQSRCRMTTSLVGSCVRRGGGTGGQRTAQAEEERRRERVASERRTVHLGPVLAARNPPDLPGETRGIDALLILGRLRGEAKDAIPDWVPGSQCQCRKWRWTGRCECKKQGPGIRISGVELSRLES